MRSLHHDRLQDWAWRPLTIVGEACRVVKAETLERIVDWSVDKLMLEHWAVPEIKEGKLCMPKVSVIIPTHNRAEFLRSAITSVLNQTFQDFEIAIIDDASKDHTRAVITNFNDARI